jgi:hypothetical protein
LYSSARERQRASARERPRASARERQRASAPRHSARNRCGNSYALDFLAVPRRAQLVCPGFALAATRVPSLATRPPWLQGVGNSPALAHGNSRAEQSFLIIYFVVNYKGSRPQNDFQKMSLLYKNAPVYHRRFQMCITINMALLKQDGQTSSRAT